MSYYKSDIPGACDACDCIPTPTPTTTVTPTPTSTVTPTTTPTPTSILFCPQYPVTVYITGGVVTEGGYRSLEIQCLDANNVRVYQKRQSNGGTFAVPFTYSNGLPVLDPDPEPPNSAGFQGCLPVEVHQFVTANDAPFEVFPVGQTDGFSITIHPDEFQCCVPYEYQDNWCDNPQGVCEPPPTP